MIAPHELVVDSFAGGGGASTGIEAALGRPVDVAINHDAAAIAMHAANHPRTRHYREDVWAFLVKYYGANGTTDGAQQSLFEPLHTVTAKARFGLVQVHGEPYEIADIGMRMLAPRELFAAQGFPASYVIAPTVNGRPMNKTAQIERAGNSVVPALAEAIVRANLGSPAREVAA